MADRTQKIEDWYAAGFISIDEAMALLDFPELRTAVNGSYHSRDTTMLQTCRGQMDLTDDSLRIFKELLSNMEQLQRYGVTRVSLPCGQDACVMIELQQTPVEAVQLDAASPPPLTSSTRAATLIRPEDMPELYGAFGPDALLTDLPPSPDSDDESERNGDELDLAHL